MIFYLVPLNSVLIVMPAIPDATAQVYDDAKTQRIVLFAVFMVLFHLVALVSFERAFTCLLLLRLICIRYLMYLTKVQAYWLLKLYRNESSEVRHQGKIRIS